MIDVSEEVIGLSEGEREGREYGDLHIRALPRVGHSILAVLSHANIQIILKNFMHWCLIIFQRLIIYWYLSRYLADEQSNGHPDSL